MHEGIVVCHGHEQAPAALSVEPLKLAPGAVLRLTAGQAVPAAEVSVVDGARKQITRALLGGEVHNLEVKQRLWRMTSRPAAASVPEPAETRPSRWAATETSHCVR